MANEGANPAERAVSFVMRLLASMALPAWGAYMIFIGARQGLNWWIATGAVVFVIGVIFFAGSSIITPLLPGSRPSPDRWRSPASRQ